MFLTLGLFILTMAMYALQSCTRIPSENDNVKLSAEILREYTNVPHDEIFHDPILTDELKLRYKEYLRQLKNEIDATGAKFVVTYITPEIGNSITSAQKIGRDCIKRTCKELGIEFRDFSTAISALGSGATQAPRDIYWSKKGAAAVARQLKKVIDDYSNYAVYNTYRTIDTIWGSLPPNMDSVLDGGKGVHYRLVSNAQGFRMDYDLASNKQKQRVLLLGDSAMFFPFLDNQDTGSGLLQAIYPNKEIINAANWGYSVDDHLDLYKKAKYADPDIVIMQTSSADISDLYFTNRNIFSRKGPKHWPSEAEVRFYNEILAQR